MSVHAFAALDYTAGEKSGCQKCKTNCDDEILITLDRVRFCDRAHFVHVEIGPMWPCMWPQRKKAASVGGAFFV